LYRTNNKYPLEYQVKGGGGGGSIIHWPTYPTMVTDLFLIDINILDMNGSQLCTEILKVDVNVKRCFMSSWEVNHEAIRELYPTISIGSFIKKPVAINYLVKRINAEIE
jgi:response regulator RpfG family c-di-GMP phosphodiesterase